MKARNYPRKHERGQSLVELALFMTFLFVLLAGVVDIGRAFFTYISLRDAAQEGAMFASIEETKCQQAVGRVRMSGQNPVDLSDASVIQVSCQVIGNPCAASTGHPGGEVKVTVKYEDFPITMPFLGTLIGTQSIDISAYSTDNILTPVCE